MFFETTIEKYIGKDENWNLALILQLAPSSLTMCEKAALVLSRQCL